VFSSNSAVFLYASIYLSTLLTTLSKKRKAAGEIPVFKEKWALEYFSAVFKQKALCSIFKEMVRVMQDYNNLKRHYDTKHTTSKKNDLEGHFFE
jgi:hypothetical protein